MNREILRIKLFEALIVVAPEIQERAIHSERPLRDQVDLDSMDWLDFIIALRDKTGVTVAEADYARLSSVNDLLDYLETHVGSTA